MPAVVAAAPSASWRGNGCRGPLSRTKPVASGGMTDIRNNLAATAMVQAASREAAAGPLLDHPHFMIFPGEGVEVMEALPIPAKWQLASGICDGIGTPAQPR
jgi:hypothetical protein